MARQFTSRQKQGSAAEPVQTKRILTDAAAGNGNPGLFLEREETARMAYSFWEDRGYQGGSPEEDWFRAEMELHAKLTSEGCGKSSLQRQS